MAKYAVVENNFVTNVIIIEPEQVEEMAVGLNAELVDAEPFRLAIGDYRRGGKTWTRNVDGEQVVLTEKPTYAELEEALRKLQEGGSSTDE